MNIRKTIATFGRFVKRKSPTILSAVAVIGAVVTPYLAVKAVQKVSDDDDWVDTVTNYAAPVAAGLITVGCIVASDRIHVSRETGMMLSYNALAHSVNTEKLKELAGATGGAAALKLAGNAENKEMDTEEKWFFDDFASSRLGYGVFYKTTWKNVLTANLHIQDSYLTDGYASAREYYKELNKLANSPDIDALVHQLSDDFGWDCDLLINDYGCPIGIPFDYGDNDLLTPEGEPCSGIYFSIIPEFAEF